MSTMMAKVPPQSLEAEQSVLGAMLIQREAISKAVDLIRTEDFYRESHRKIFGVIVGLFEKGQEADLITVSEALKATASLEQVGGLAYLTELTGLVPTAAHVEYYAKIVAEKALLRNIITVSTEIAAQAYEPGQEAQELLDDAERQVFTLGQRQGSTPFLPLKEILFETLENLEQNYGKNGVTGIPTGFRDLDHMLSGLQPSDLVVIAARPSMGKTMLCLNMARNVALNHNLPVVIFSLEMSREQLAMRMLCSEALVNSQSLRNGTAADEDWQRLSSALGRLGSAPIFIDDSPLLTVLELRARARRLKAEHQLGMIIIDYLQLMDARGSRQENRQQEISTISRSLKALARELKVPILALSQLSRAVEARQDKRPMLSDLRESGAIEQDADVVGFIYREDYYNLNAAPEDQNVAEIVIAKQRNGPTGMIKLSFRREYGRFFDVDHRH